MNTSIGTALREYKARIKCMKADVIRLREALTDQKIKTAQAWAMVDRMESLVYWIAKYAYPTTGLYPDDIKMAREIMDELEAREDRG